MLLIHFSAPKKLLCFSIRPLELMFVDQLKPYFKLFVRQPAKKAPNVQSSLLTKTPRPWVDATGSVFKIRSTAFDQLQVWFNTLSSQSSPTLDHFRSILRRLNQPDYSSTYVFDSSCISSCPPEIVFSKVYPKSQLNFLLHLLYTMGHFSTELDLFSASSLR